LATPIPCNQASFSLTELLACTGGAVRGPLSDAAMSVVGVSTDTRVLRPGEAFVALSGERFDGHEHLAKAAAAGACLAIVQRDAPSPAGLTTLHVESTLEALGKLASAHVQRWREARAERRVLALSGSAGKTTTKRVVVSLLQQIAPGAVCAAAGNLNNLIGVPMTLLTLDSEHRYAVLELGTNSPGEIGALARMVRPNLGLLTLIATAHSSGLGDIDAIALEKGALFEQLSSVDGIALGNADDERVAAALAASPAAQRSSYGRAANASYRIMSRRVLDEAERLAQLIELKRPDGTTLVLRSPLLGEAGALATVGAIGAVEQCASLRLDEQQVNAALSKLEAQSGPGRLYPRILPSGLLLIDDSYNANPASCHSSVSAAQEIAAQLGRRLVLVLGEMRELGDEAAAAHRSLGMRAAESAAALLIAVCGQAALIAERASEEGLQSLFAADSDRAAELACARVTPADVVLVKGSRGVQTERVVQALSSAHSGSAGTCGPRARVCVGGAL